MIYTPKPSMLDRVARKLRPFQNVRRLDFQIDTPIISITFDDFPKSAVDIGAQEMEKRGMLGTFYTCAGMAGQSNHHGPLFDVADLIKLDAAGHEIAGHTYSHVDCLNVSEPDLATEISKNREALAEMGVRQSIDNFAFPFGQNSAGLKARLEREFDSLRGITDGVHLGSADLNELKSCGFYTQTADRVLKRVEDLKNNPGWLTVFTHDIQENPTQWGCTKEQFISLLDVAEKIGARVMTVRDAVTTLEAANG